MGAGGTLIVVAKKPPLRRVLRGGFFFAFGVWATWLSVVDFDTAAGDERNPGKDGEADTKAGGRSRFRDSRNRRSCAAEAAALHHD